MNIRETLLTHLGLFGKMFSGSKVDYLQRHINHKVFFNACVFNKTKEQIWWGDIDLDIDTPQLQSLANEIGTIFVTSEYPFRWDGLEKGATLYPENVVRFDPTEEQK